MQDRRIDLSLPVPGWLLAVLYGLTALASLICILLALVRLIWEPELLMLILFTALLGLGTWTLQPRPAFIELTAAGIERTHVRGLHSPKDSAAFVIPWQDLQSWQWVVQEHADGEVSRFVELRQGNGTCYQQSRQAEVLAEELRRRAPDKEGQAVATS